MKTHQEFLRKRVCDELILLESVVDEKEKTSRKMQVKDDLETLGLLDHALENIDDSIVLPPPSRLSRPIFIPAIRLRNLCSLACSFLLILSSLGQKMRVFDDVIIDIVLPLLYEPELEVIDKLNHMHLTRWWVMILGIWPKPLVEMKHHAREYIVDIGYCYESFVVVHIQMTLVN